MRIAELNLIKRVDPKRFAGLGWYKRPRAEAENGVVLHGGLYGPPYELPVGQNGGHGFSGKVISIIH